MSAGDIIVIIAGVLALGCIVVGTVFMCIGLRKGGNLPFGPDGDL